MRRGGSQDEQLRVHVNRKTRLFQDEAILPKAKVMRNPRGYTAVWVSDWRYITTSGRHASSKGRHRVKLGGCLLLLTLWRCDELQRRAQRYAVHRQAAGY